MISVTFRLLKTLPVATIYTPLHSVNSRTRLVSSGQSTTEQEPLSEASFEKFADETLERLTDQIDQVLDTVNDAVDSDVSLSSGVLTVNLGPKGIYVINKQTPNKQLWLSSPISGPKRFDYESNSWRYKRDGVTLTEILNKEFSQILSQKVEIKIS